MSHFGLPYPEPSSARVSALMKGNRRADTTPELALRSELHRRGLRFRKDVLIREGDVRVRVDIVFRRQRVAVFVDGCFWHACPDHGRQPSVNRPYWNAKLRRNKDRDGRVTEGLRAAGWTVLRFWEHEGVVRPGDDVERMVTNLTQAVSVH